MPNPIPRPAALLLAACCGLTRSALAADAPPAVEIGRVWVGSQDAALAAAGQLGVPVPLAARLASVEAAFPFLQPGDLRTDAPVGMVFLGGDAISQQQMAVFALPAQPKAIPLANLPGAAKTDAADTVTANGMPFRRTPDYLLLGGTLPVTTALDAAAQSAALRPAGGTVPLARLSLDLAAWRAAAPKQFAAAMAAMDKDDVVPAGPAAREAGRQAGRAWVQSMVRDQLDRLSVAVDKGPAGWTAVTHVEPFPRPAAAAAAWDRPGLPDGCVARADLRVPAEVVSDGIAKLIGFGQEPGGRNLSPAGAKLAGRLLATLFAGDVETVGLASVDGKLTVYAVAQRAEAGDLAAELAAVAADARQLDAAGERFGAADVTAVPYAAADGSTVYRLPVRQTGGGATTIDVTARGHARYTTLVVGSDAHLVEGLAGLKPDGKFDAIAAGWVEPGPLMDVVPPDAGLSADQRARVKAALGTARVTWTATAAGAGADLTADLPDPLLKAVGPVVQAMTGG